MKLGIIYKTAPLYREAVFTAMDKEYDCEWYFGHTTNDIKEMDVSKLKRVHYYKTIGNTERIYWQCGILRLLLKRELNVFLLLAETRCVSMWLFLFLNLIIRKKVYVWSHGWYGKESKTVLFIKRLLFSMVDGTFLYGDYSKSIMVRQGFNPNRIYVIHNSLDYEKQLQLRNTLRSTDVFFRHFGNKNPVIIMIGRLNLRKQLTLLIDALDIIIKKGHNYNLVLIGDGEDRSKLIDRVRDRHLEKFVWFYGACYDEEQNAELLFNSDLCVVPGDIGLTAIHSLMFGVPVITHNAFMFQGPEFEAIKPCLTGDFFEHGSATDLAQKIQDWFDNNPASKRTSVRKNCYNEIDSCWTPNYQIEVLKLNLR